VDAEGKLSSTSTQRIKLTLQPTLGATTNGGGQSAPQGPAVSPVSVYVHGNAVTGER
jgi:hypothetical protein